MSLLRSYLGRLGVSVQYLSQQYMTTMSAVKKIGTHNGNFHCDEVLACYMLKQLDEYKNAEIVRTRDPTILSQCDIVVDVGGVFDPQTHRYDHHQRTFKESMHSLNATYRFTTKLSSAGLVYFHFGSRVIDAVLKKVDLDCPPEMNKILYDKVYEFFVEEVDGVDNGINVADGDPRYAQTTGLSARVGYHNPWWNSPDQDEFVQFNKAMTMVGAEFEDRVRYYAQCWWPARTMVEQAISNRYQVDDSGEIIRFDQGGCPWKDHLFSIEEEQSISPSIKYVLYSDQSGQSRVQCVPLILGKFENRLSLPDDWRGLRDEELSNKSGIPGCIFVHSGGFIGGHTNYDGALQMARLALKRKNVENGTGAS